MNTLRGMVAGALLMAATILTIGLSLRNNALVGVAALAAPALLVILILAETAFGRTR